MLHISLALSLLLLFSIPAALAHGDDDHNKKDSRFRKLMIMG